MIRFSYMVITWAKLPLYEEASPLNVSFMQNQSRSPLTLHDSGFILVGWESYLFTVFRASCFQLTIFQVTDYSEKTEDQSGKKNRIEKFAPQLHPSSQYPGNGIALIYVPPVKELSWKSPDKDLTHGPKNLNNALPNGIYLLNKICCLLFIWWVSTDCV